MIDHRKMIDLLFFLNFFTIMLVFFVGGIYIVLPVADFLFMLFTGYSLGLYGAVLPF
jgi:uncharacterized membrane protein SpoIIM required for sporulation